MEPNLRDFSENYGIEVYFSRSESQLKGRLYQAIEEIAKG